MMRPPPPPLGVASGSAGQLARVPRSPLPLGNEFDVCRFGSGNLARTGRERQRPKPFLYLSAEFSRFRFRINENHV